MQEAQKMTPREFNKQYGEIMLNGLSSVSTYIPLRSNARLGINVAIRPMVFRANDQVVVFGGKFRVGYTLDASRQPVQSKVTALTNDIAENQLTEFCKGFSWQKQSFRRFSTIIGVGVAASKYDGELALERIVEDGIANDFLNRLERTYKQYNDCTFTAKNKAADALRDAWLLQAQSGGVFVAMPSELQLPDAVVGKTSKVLNKAQDKYYDNVVSFQQTVIRLWDKDLEIAE